MPTSPICHSTWLLFVGLSLSIGARRALLVVPRFLVEDVPTYPNKGDSLIDGKWLFEIGGEKKSFEQIKDMPKSYLAVDDIEVGRRNRIPLWLFGFLY